MATLEKEIEGLQEEMEEREPGVMDLIDMYLGVESIYVEASASSAISYNIATSDSTNAYSEAPELSR